MSLKQLEMEVEKTKRFVQGVFALRKQTNTLSKVHDWSHVHAVARHAKIVAEVLAASQGMSGEKIKRIGLVAEAAGYLHDVLAHGH